MPTKMKSKLKLKSRKKSEATPEFLKKEVINDCDSDSTSLENNEDCAHITCEELCRNITNLASTHQVECVKSI